MNNGFILLFKYEDDGEKFVCAVKWLGVTTNSKCHRLAITSNFGDLEIWEIGEMIVTNFQGEMRTKCERKMVRKLTIEFIDNDKQIMALSSNDNILSVGSVSGRVEHHDLRLTKSLVAVTTFHKKVLIIKLFCFFLFRTKIILLSKSYFRKFYKWNDLRIRNI